MLRVSIRGVKKTEAKGKSGIENRRNPYVPNFNRMPAKITDPAVGASTWASGNHMWTGSMGTFTAKLAKNANHNINSRVSLKDVVYKICRLVVPV
jgi:hypothetical protein